MSKRTIQGRADDIVASFAGSQEHGKISAVRGFCNSDSAFVEWSKKAAFSIPAIRNARLIQQAWKRFGAARSLLITLRAIKAVVARLLVGVELARVNIADAIDFLKSVTGVKSDPVAAQVGVGASLAPQDMFV